MKYNLKSCVWELTLECCFSCSHCGSKAGRSRKDELSLNECLDVVDQLGELGCRSVSLIGGEVFLYPDWDIVAEFLARAGIRTCIITNGYMIDEAIIQKMKNAHVRHVCISIDGTEPHHDRIRIAGSYQRAIAAAEILKKEGFFVSVITTLNQQNAEDLNSLYEVFCKLGVDAWQLQNCVPMGNAVDMMPPGLSAQRDIHRFVAEKAAEGSLKIGLAHNVGYFSEEELWVRGAPLGNQSFGGCTAGLSSVAIDSVGNVRGCESLYDECFIEGNIRRQSLAEIWNAKSAFSYNRAFSVKKLTGSCRKCRYNQRCAGGCRSMNYFLSKKMYESPVCVTANTKDALTADSKGLASVFCKREN